MENNNQNTINFESQVFNKDNTYLPSLDDTDFLDFCKFQEKCNKPNCPFFHNFPCKYFHSETGCKFGKKCRYSHNFSKENTEFYILGLKKNINNREGNRDRGRSRDGNNNRGGNNDRGRSRERNNNGGNNNRDRSRDGNNNRGRSRDGNNNRGRSRDGNNNRGRSRNGNNNRDRSRDGNNNRGRSRNGNNNRDRSRNGNNNRDRSRDGNNNRINDEE